MARKIEVGYNDNDDTELDLVLGEGFVGTDFVDIVISYNDVRYTLFSGYLNDHGAPYLFEIHGLPTGTKIRIEVSWTDYYGEQGELEKTPTTHGEKPPLTKCYIYTDGEWKPAVPYVYNGSSWVKTTMYLYDGSWKK